MDFNSNMEQQNSPTYTTTKAADLKSSFGLPENKEEVYQIDTNPVPHVLKSTSINQGFNSSSMNNYSSALQLGPPIDSFVKDPTTPIDGQIDREKFIHKLLEMASVTPSILPFLTLPFQNVDRNFMDHQPIQPTNELRDMQYPNITSNMAMETNKHPSIFSMCNGFDINNNMLQKYVSPIDLPSTTFNTAPSTAMPTKGFLCPEINPFMDKSIPKLPTPDKGMFDKSLEQANPMHQIANLLQLQTVPNAPPFFFPIPAQPPSLLPSSMQTYSTSSSAISSIGSCDITQNRPTGGQPLKTEDDFCELCQKHFCNKYYLRKHKADVHGIYTEPHSHVRRREAAVQSASYINGANRTTVNPLEKIRSTSTSVDAPLKMEADESSTMPTNKCDVRPVVNPSLQSLAAVELPLIQRSPFGWSQLPHLPIKNEGNLSVFETTEPSTQGISANSPALSTGVSLQGDLHHSINLGSDCPSNLIPPGMLATRNSSSLPMNSFESMLSAHYCMLALTGSLPQGLGQDMPIPFSKHMDWNTGDLKTELGHHPPFTLSDFDRGINGMREVKCDQCQKLFCNQYFLQVHRVNHHGNVDGLDNPSKKYISKHSLFKNQASEYAVEVTNKTGNGFHTINNLPSNQQNDSGNSLPKDMSESFIKPDNSLFPEYKPVDNSDQANSSKNMLAPNKGSLSEFKTNTSVSLDAFKTSMVAAKLADRVTCDLCKKELCNKYFLRTHKIRVHGVSPRDVGGPPMRNPPVVPASVNATQLITSSSVSSTKIMKTSTHDPSISDRENRLPTSIGPQVRPGTPLSASKPSFASSGSPGTESASLNAADVNPLTSNQFTTLPSPFYPFPYVPLVPQLFQVNQILPRENDYMCGNSIITTPGIQSVTSGASNMVVKSSAGFEKIGPNSFPLNWNTLAFLPGSDKQPPWFPQSNGENVPSNNSLRPGNGTGVYCPLCEHPVGPRFLLPAHLTSIHNLSPMETNFFLYLLQAKSVFTGGSELVNNTTGSACITTSTTDPCPSWAFPSAITTCIPNGVQVGLWPLKNGQSGNDTTTNSESSNSVVRANSNPLQRENSDQLGCNGDANARINNATSVDVVETGTLDVPSSETVITPRTGSCDYNYQTPLTSKPDLFDSRKPDQSDNGIHHPYVQSHSNCINERQFKITSPTIDKNQYFATDFTGVLPSSNIPNHPISVVAAAASDFAFMGSSRNQFGSTATSEPALQKVVEDVNNDIENNSSSPTMVNPSSVGGISWTPLNATTETPASSVTCVSPLQNGSFASSGVPSVNCSVPSGTGGTMPRKSPNQMRVLCDICNKWICNKYFLRTHKANKHGITESNQHLSSSVDNNYKQLTTKVQQNQRFNAQGNQVYGASLLQPSNFAVPSNNRHNFNPLNEDLDDAVALSMAEHLIDESVAGSLQAIMSSDAFPKGIDDNKYWFGRPESQKVLNLTCPTLQTSVHDQIVMNNLNNVCKDKRSDTESKLNTDLSIQGPQLPPVNRPIPFPPFGGYDGFFLPGTRFPSGPAILPLSVAPVPMITATNLSNDTITSSDEGTSLNSQVSEGRMNKLYQNSQTLERNTSMSTIFSVKNEKNEPSRSFESDEELKTPLNLSFSWDATAKMPERHLSRPHKVGNKRSIHLASHYLQRAVRHRRRCSRFTWTACTKSERWRNHHKEVGRNAVIPGHHVLSQRRIKYRFRRLNDKKSVHRASSLDFILSYQKNASGMNSMTESSSDPVESASSSGILFPVYDTRECDPIKSMSADFKYWDQHEHNHNRNDRILNSVPNSVSHSPPLSDSRQSSHPHNFQISQLARSSRNLEPNLHSPWASGEDLPSEPNTTLPSAVTELREVPAGEVLMHRSLMIPLKAYGETLSTTL